MKRTLPLLIALCVVAPFSAFASKDDGPKAKLMAKYDLNHNGVIDPDEAAAIRKDFAANPDGELKHFDKDRDGKLSDDEIAAMAPKSSKKGSKKKSKSGDEGSDEKPASPDAAVTDSAAATTSAAVTAPAATTSSAPAK